MSTADIGLIGLGVMGGNLALNIAENGYKIAVTNRTASRIDKFVDEAKNLRPQLVPQADLTEFVKSIKRPRSILIMIKAGQPVDDQIADLLPLLAEGDAILECGNSLFSDTERRYAMLKEHGIGYLGVGVSGGEEGARHGPSIMVGGAEAQWKNAAPVLNAIAADFKGSPCCAYLGTGGAGHFVKTIHNGIEYADMQMIAEVYGVMRDGLGMQPRAMAEVFRKWNEGSLNSYLIEITSHVLDAMDETTDTPLIDLIVDKAGQKGTGRWSAIVAQEMGVPATGIEGAVAARSLSALKGERQKAEKIYGKAKPEGDFTLADLENALLAGKIVAYAQGFAVLTAASEANQWDLPLARIAEIWRAGCIIRSKFLDDMSAAYGGGGHINLLMVDEFITIMKGSIGPLRKLVGYGAAEGLPLISLSSALSYFDSYRQGRGTANLIQGQRDFFGAHGFEIDGREGPQHHDWPSLPNG